MSKVLGKWPVLAYSRPVAGKISGQKCDPFQNTIKYIIMFKMRGAVDGPGAGQKTGLTRVQFEQLAEVPPEEEWLANITSPKTRRAYQQRRAGIHRVCRSG